LFIYFVLKARSMALEVHREMEGQPKGKQRDDQRKYADVAITPREKQ